VGGGVKRRSTTIGWFLMQNDLYSPGGLHLERELRIVFPSRSLSTATGRGTTPFTFDFFNESILLLRFAV
jgi:hypothetical protein